MTCLQERKGKGKSWNMARQKMINLDTCFLSDTHHWYITTETCCPPAREGTGLAGKQRGVISFSAYLVHDTYTTNRLLMSLFMEIINSLHKYKYWAELLAYQLLLFNHNLCLHCTQMTAILWEMPGDLNCCKVCSALPTPKS